MTSLLKAAASLPPLDSLPLWEQAKEERRREAQEREERRYQRHLDAWGASLGRFIVRNVAHVNP